MSWNQRGPGFERRGYHHGNLREALLDAALELIAAKGPAGLAIAEAARLAGVSPAAPYRHFRDADALIAEVAVRGFERFADALTRAWNDGRPDPIHAFEALGRAYLAFARQEPAYYAAMFEGKRLCKFAPDGRLLAEIPVPVMCPTMPCFGGDDLQTLYLTTARHGRSARELADLPLSGCVLSMRVDTPGLPVNFFQN